MDDDNVSAPEEDDSESLGGTLGRTIGGAFVMFALIAAVGAIAWMIFK